MKERYYDFSFFDLEKREFFACVFWNGEGGIRNVDLVKILLVNVPVESFNFSASLNLLTSFEKVGFGGFIFVWHLLKLS